MPPIGAPKADVTPAAAPQATKSRFSRSLRKSENLEKDVSTPQNLVRPWENSGRDNGAAVDHGALLPYRQTSRDGERDPNYLAEQCLDADNAGKVDAVEEALDFGDPGTAADRLEVHEVGRDGGENCLVKKVGAEGHP